MKMQGNKQIYRSRRTGWRWLAASFLSLLTLTTGAQTTVDGALQRCGTVAYERLLQQRDPNRLRQLNELDRRLNQAEMGRMLLRQAADDETIYRIPVVVHVVHNTASGQTGGVTNANISDEQIASQIRVLNEDYRRQPGTNGFNTNPVGADARIEFFLADKDPTGQPSNGITRHYYPQKTSFDVFADDVLLSQIAYWPSDRYLNIWVTTVDTYLGFTQLPTMADTLSGLPPTTNEFTDGSIIDYRYFGRQIGTVRDPTYCCGRTATHEIGHWLGLKHTWGDAFCGTDYVADTPPTEAANETVFCRDVFSTCSGARTRNMIENFMDYSPDLCMNVFTFGQVGRMRAVLRLSPRRFRLIQSVTSPLTETEALTINVYPNPAVADFVVDVQLKGFQSFSIDIIDLTGRLVRATQYSDSPSTRVLLSTNQVATGLYVVRVKTASESVSRWLLVQ